MTLEFERGRAGRARRRAAGAGRAARSASAEIGARHGVGHRRPHRGPHRRAEGARHLRGAGRGDPPAGPPGARAARLHDPPEPVQGASSTASGPTSSTRGCGGSRCAAISTPTWRASTSGHRHDRREALQGPRARRHALLAQRRLRRGRWRRSRSPAGCSRRPPRPASSSCGRCSRAWPGGCATSSWLAALRITRGARRVAWLR